MGGSDLQKIHSKNLDLNLQSDEHFAENTQQDPGSDITRKNNSTNPYLDQAICFTGLLQYISCTPQSSIQILLLSPLETRFFAAGEKNA